MEQTINGIVINDIIKNDIITLINEKPCFSTHDIVKVLEKYLLPYDVMQLLEVGRTSYYRFKRERSLKFVDRKVYDLYRTLEY